MIPWMYSYTSPLGLSRRCNRRLGCRCASICVCARVVVPIPRSPGTERRIGRGSNDPTSQREPRAKKYPPLLTPRQGYLELTLAAFQYECQVGTIDLKHHRGILILRPPVLRPPAEIQRLRAVKFLEALKQVGGVVRGAFHSRI